MILSSSADAAAKRIGQKKGAAPTGVRSYAASCHDPRPAAAGACRACSAEWCSYGVMRPRAQAHGHDRQLRAAAHGSRPGQAGSCMPQDWHSQQACGARQRLQHQHQLTAMRAEHAPASLQPAKSQAQSCSHMYPCMEDTCMRLLHTCGWTPSNSGPAALRPCRSDPYFVCLTILMINLAWTTSCR